MKAPRLAEVLVFGEDSTDTDSLKELLPALRRDLPRVRPMRQPPVLLKDARATKAKRTAGQIAATVRAAKVNREVVMVIAHQDCDDVEPAHQALALKIETALATEDVQAIAATPAWEIETWWFLWPQAVVAAFPSWRRPVPPQESVGLIRNAKEAFRRAVRPAGKPAGMRDYRESDSPKIAAKVRDLGIVDQKAARSDSFDRFAEKVRAARFP